MKKRLVFSIDDKGEMEFIHNDEVKELVDELGLMKDIRTKRASNVEPADDGTWYVDMSPLNLGLYEGFKTRKEAIAFEINKIEELHLGLRG